MNSVHQLKLDQSDFVYWSQLAASWAPQPMGFFVTVKVSHSFTSCRREFTKSSIVLPRIVRLRYKLTWWCITNAAEFWRSTYGQIQDGGRLSNFQPRSNLEYCCVMCSRTTRKKWNTPTMNEILGLSSPPKFKSLNRCNSATDCSISVVFRTVFDHVTPDVLQPFKVKCRRSKSLRAKRHLIDKLLLTSRKCRWI